MKFLERKIKNAAADYQVKKQQLYRHNGSSIYSQEELGERLARLDTELGEKLAAVVMEAEVEQADVEREQLSLLYADNLTNLSDSELSRVATLKSFVIEDIENLPVPALTARFQLATATGDQVLVSLLRRYAPRRLETEMIKPTATTAELTELRSLLLSSNEAASDEVSNLQSQITEAKRIQSLARQTEAELVDAVGQETAQLRRSGLY